MNSSFNLDTANGRTGQLTSIANVRFPNQGEADSILNQPHSDGLSPLQIASASLDGYKTALARIKSLPIRKLEKA